MVDGAGDGLTVVVAGLGVVAVAVGCVALAEAEAEPEAEAVPEWLAKALEPAPPDADDDPDGEKIAGTLDDGEPVQAERAMPTRTIKVAQNRTASRGRPAVLAEVMRTLIKPP